ncbi:MAG TPA: hypothetical protein VE822_09255 [Candidatus Elarobacter sp.]|nr:hypothetical protein [Candidatus Elarobacter sp.]
MIQKIRKQFEQIRGKKHHSFDDFDPIIRRCLSEYAHLFPERQINKAGSKVVYHFNVEGVEAISLEKEHGSREFVPRHYAKLAMVGIEDLITFIENAEGRKPAAEEIESHEERESHTDVASTTEPERGQDAALPPPKVSDGDR